MSEAELIALGITTAASLLQNQIALAKAKAAADATSADDRAKLVAAIDAVAVENQALNDRWLNERR